MPFNGSGVFSIVNTFTPGTTIASASVNANFTDIATGLSDVLTRDGQAPMTAQLKLINGSTSTPSMAFASDPTTGIYRASSGTVGVSGALSATGAVNGTTIQQNSLTLIPVGFGPVPWSGTSAPSGWLLCGATYSRSTYAALWAFAQTEISNGNTWYTTGDGSTTFGIASTIGYALAGVDAASARIPSFTTLGATAGAATYTLVTGNLPPYTPAGSISATVPLQGDSSHSGSNVSAALIGNNGTGGTQVSVTNPTFTGTAAAGQISTPFSIVQPIRAVNHIIFAGA